MKNKAVKEKIDKTFKSSFNSIDCEKSDAGQNVFEMAESSMQEKRLSDLKFNQPKIYRTEMQKQRAKAGLVKGFLSVIREVLENLELLN